MAACANVQTQPTALATDTTAPTATVAIATATLVSTETPTLATTEAPQIPPEILTAVDWHDARNKILPYCEVRSDLADGPDSVKVLEMVPKIPELWTLIEAKVKNGEIMKDGYGGSVVNQPNGSGGCIVVILYKDAFTETGILFKSKFDGSWVEVKLTGKK
jgi:hypothetical protein